MSAPEFTLAELKAMREIIINAPAIVIDDTSHRSAVESKRRLIDKLDKHIKRIGG